MAARSTPRSANLLGLQETVEITENAILMPIFSKQAVSTTVDVADGATVAVGGLMQESVQNVNDKTPVLGGIPIVGRLFQIQREKAGHQRDHVPRQRGTHGSDRSPLQDR